MDGIAAQRKGVVLAGGAGTRLYPMTQAVVKQLLPVYDKPLIYYALSTIMLAGVREIMIITAERDQPIFRALLGDGARFGVRLSYAVQERPEGIAQALTLAEAFLDGAGAWLVLGDNVLFGAGLEEHLALANQSAAGATIFAHRVADPQRYGIVTFDAVGAPVAIDEKPARPGSPYAVTGLYCYDGRAPALARTLKKSARSEFETTDLNRLYLEEGRLRCVTLGRGYAWFDAGTPESLLEAAHFVQTLQRRQSLGLACIEEIAWRKGWISAAELAAFAQSIAGSDYGRYLLRLMQEEA